MTFRPRITLLTMTSNDLFGAMPVALATEILEYSHATDKKLYRAAVEAVAQARKERSVFLERQPREQRHSFMIGSLNRPDLAVAADTLLRHWLLKKHNALLVDFLNALGVPHEHGVVENLPKTVDDAVLKNAINQLLAKHPAPGVAVYLHAFNSMNGENWTNLDTDLHEDDRLELKK